jgi:hypothetical protein
MGAARHPQVSTDREIPVKRLSESDISPLWDAPEHGGYACGRDFYSHAPLHRARILRFATAVLERFGGISEADARERERAVYAEGGIEMQWLMGKHLEDGEWHDALVGKELARRFFERRDERHPSLLPTPRTIALYGLTFSYTKELGWQDADHRDFPNGPYCRTPEDFEACARIMREAQSA